MRISSYLPQTTRHVQPINRHNIIVKVHDSCNCEVIALNNHGGGTLAGIPFQDQEYNRKKFKISRIIGVYWEGGVLLFEISGFLPDSETFTYLTESQECLS